MAPPYRRSDTSTCSHLSSNVAASPLTAVVPVCSHPPLVAPWITTGNVGSPQSPTGLRPWEVCWSESS